MVGDLIFGGIEIVYDFNWCVILWVMERNGVFVNWSGWKKGKNEKETSVDGGGGSKMKLEFRVK